MKPPIWLRPDVVRACHDECLRAFGGSAGVRDEGLLASALARAEHRWHYDDVDLPWLAAAYAYGLVKNHPFVDGNKRVAFLCAAVFLERNGCRLTADPAHAVVFVQALAAGEIDEIGFAAWLRDNTQRKRRTRGAAKGAAKGRKGRSRRKDGRTR